MSIEAMKLALDELAYWRDKVLRDEADFVADEYDETITALRQAIEQAQKQEHVIDCPRCGHCCPQAEQAQKQEPAALQHWSDCAVHNEPAYPAGKCDCGGYTTPPPHQPLTDEEFISMMDSSGIVFDPILSLAFEIKDLIEAAHGIKGEA